MSAKILFFGLLIWFSIESSIAVQVQEWGEVTDEEWAIQSFQEDEDAHSVILFDSGESYVDKDLKVVHTRHRRVKILNPELSDLIDVRISVYDDRKVQIMRSLSAHTINRDADGNEVITEIGRRDFFTEDSGNYEITTFTFPAIEEGSIIEYRYRMEYGSPVYLPDWTFQDSSPILFSEYNVMVPEMLNFREYNYGYEAFENITDRSEVLSRMQNYRNTVRVNPKYTLFRNVLKNGPAIRNESHVTSLSNYKNRVTYQLIGYIDNRGAYTSYMATWEEIVEQLMDSRNFDGRISTRRSIRRATEDLIEGIDNDLDQAKAIYDYVAKNIQWDGRFRLFPSDGASDLLDDLNGNSSDKAIVLISMLRSVGFTAEPVLISTRANGWIDWRNPTLEAFNHVMVALEVDETIILLDPLDKVIPFGVLYPSSINKSGLLAVEDQPKIIDILPQLSSSSHSSATVKLDENGGVTTSLRASFEGYEAIAHRFLAEKEGEEEYINSQILDHLPDSEIVEKELRELDNTAEPFSVVLQINNNQYSTVAGDMIYLNPFLIDRVTDNPFSNPERNFPVEFNYGTSKLYTATIVIPEGFEVIEVPENLSLKFSESMAFSFISQQVGNSIQLRMTKVNNEPEVDAELYDELRNYFASVSEVYNKQIVLRKLSEEELNVESANVDGSGK